MFLNISTAGIPIAISKIITEYNTLEMYEAKERSYKVGRNIILMLSVLAFFVLLFCTWSFSFNTWWNWRRKHYSRCCFCNKKCIICLLIIPFLSVSKGYLQGHNYITPASISQVIEQVVRIAVILFGSYIVISVLGKSVTLGVGISVFGAFVGGLAAYLYIKYK